MFHHDMQRWNIKTVWKIELIGNRFIEKEVSVQVCNNMTKKQEMTDLWNKVERTAQNYKTHLIANELALSR